MNMTNVLESPDQFVETVPNLLQGVLEGLVDGVLILTQQGKCLYENLSARRICQQINQQQPQTDAIPQPVWYACKALINSHDWYADRSLVVESEIVLNREMTYRIRVRWLQQNQPECPTLLVTLEDCYQSLQNLAIAETQRYGLTPKQAEVWLLRRAGYSYREIAAELWIAVDTVKKHLKDIYAKQKETLELDE